MLEADETAEQDAEVTVEDGRNEVGSKRHGLLRMDPCIDKHCDAGRVCKVCQRQQNSARYYVRTTRVTLNHARPYFCHYPRSKSSYATSASQIVC